MRRILNHIRSREDALRLRDAGYGGPAEGDDYAGGVTYPSLAAAQQFLRERHGIIVTPECLSLRRWRFTVITNISAGKPLSSGRG